VFNLYVLYIVVCSLYLSPHRYQIQHTHHALQTTHGTLQLTTFILQTPQYTLQNITVKLKKKKKDDNIK